MTDATDATAIAADRTPRPRTPGMLQVGLTITIAVLLAAVTLTTRQQPPPAIAEFAPQAAEQIKETPKEQASQFGSGEGEGDCPPGAECAAGEGDGAGPGGGEEPPPSTSTTVAPVIGPASLKRCVGDPPRQIEDPQSPPCVPYWDESQDNGGATSPGVTKDTIRIGAAQTQPAEFYEALTAFFNSRFQLYGRRIELVHTNAGGTAGADKAKELGVFASLPLYSDVPFYRRLVKHKIVSVYRTTDFSDTDLAEASPYLWGYTRSFTQILADVGDWTCRRLAGATAKHAGEIDGQPLNARTRSFAIFLDLDTPDTALTTDVLKSALEQCGAKVPFTTSYPRHNDDALRIRNEITKIKAEGVTTVYCLCVSTNLQNLQTQAEAQRYQPEWIITSYPQLVQTDGGYSGPQMNRTFGISFGPMDRVPEDHPQIWAVREGDPDNPAGQLRTGVIGSNDIHYRAYLALMSGIQMAGPHLTPETFRDGLHRTRFPNPDHPIMAGKVGFEGDYSMTNDAAEFWFGLTDPGPYEDNQGGPTFCWVDGGRRYARGAWPQGGDPFFEGPCDSGRESVS
jgi:hypothetical protein